jgi:hypothetical protein
MELRSNDEVRKDLIDQCRAANPEHERVDQRDVNQTDETKRWLMWPKSLRQRSSRQRAIEAVDMKLSKKDRATADVSHAIPDHIASSMAPDQAGLLIDLTNLHFEQPHQSVMHPAEQDIPSTEQASGDKIRLRSMSGSSQAKDAAVKRHLPCWEHTVNQVWADTSQAVLRAETLATGKFRRTKFWPRRYWCERGILEVCDPADLQGYSSFDRDIDDFPDQNTRGDSSSSSFSLDDDDYIESPATHSGESEVSDQRELNANDLRNHTTAFKSAESLFPT